MYIGFVCARVPVSIWDAYLWIFRTFPNWFFHFLFVVTWYEWNHWIHLEHSLIWASKCFRASIPFLSHWWQVNMISCFSNIYRKSFSQIIANSLLFHQFKLAWFFLVKKKSLHGSIVHEIKALGLIWALANREML